MLRLLCVLERNKMIGEQHARSTTLSRFCFVLFRSRRRRRQQRVTVPPKAETPGAATARLSDAQEQKPSLQENGRSSGIHMQRLLLYSTSKRRAQARGCGMVKSERKKGRPGHIAAQRCVTSRTSLCSCNGDGHTCFLVDFDCSFFFCFA